MVFSDESKMIVDEKFIESFGVGSITDIADYSGWTYFTFPIDLVYIVDRSGTHLISWLNKSIEKDDWVYRNKMFFFRHERDATMFSLKWM